MKFCSLEEAFHINDDSAFNSENKVTQYSTSYGYGNQDMTHKKYYDNPYENINTEDIYEEETKQYPPLKGVCENFRFHYSTCPECIALFKSQLNIKENFDTPGDKINSINIVIILLLLLLIWIMFNNK